MIEITPLVNTRPVKRINKVVQEEQKQAEKDQTQGDEKDEAEEQAAENSTPQHIDEVV